MSIKRPDTYEHNNPKLPFVLSKNVKGGALKTADLTTLLSDFVGYEEKLEEGVTKAYVESENADYRLVNAAAVNMLVSWEKVVTGGGGATASYATITGLPSESPALQAELTRIEDKADGAQADFDYLAPIVDGKLTGTKADDGDLQSQAVVVEDNKFVSRRGLFYWWTWLKTQIITFSETITFTKMFVLTAATPNYFLTVDGSKKTETKYQPVSPYITDVAVQGYLSSPTNWNGSGMYTGPAIVQTQGAIYIDTQYQYEMFDPTTPKRTSIIGGTEHLIGTSGTPSISAGSGAGTSPTIAIAGNDVAGRITLTTGTTPTADGIVCTVTFNRPRSGPPRATIGARNKAALNLCWVSNETTNVFVVSGNLAASTQYILNYLVAQ